MANKAPNEQERRAWLDMAESWRLLIITDDQRSTGEQFDRVAPGHSTGPFNPIPDGRKASLFVQLRLKLFRRRRWFSARNRSLVRSGTARVSLEAAVARIPEIAGIIASLPVEDRLSAFDVAERSYLRTAKYLGGADDLAQRWASAEIIEKHIEQANRSHIERDTLQTEVRNQEPTKQNTLQALQEALLRAATEVDKTVIPIERSEEQ